jgi:predicted DNA-binding protein with PD1-like motif
MAEKSISCYFIIRRITMEYQRFDNRLVVRVDKGEELLQTLAHVCEKESVFAASVQGIGYTDEMKVRIYDNRTDEFIFQTLKGPMEITGLTGNIVMADNGIYPHVHIMAADETMHVKGGHLVSCQIAAVAEVILDVLPDTLRRGESDDLRLGTLRFNK